MKYEFNTWKLLPIIAMFLVASDCVGKAMGSLPQSIFADGVVWLWWIPAIGWLSATYSLWKK